MRVVEVEVGELDAKALVLAIADAVHAHGLAMREVGVAEGGDSYVCMSQYDYACARLANDLRAAVKRFDSGVLRHLEGPCKAH